MRVGVYSGPDGQWRAGLAVDLVLLDAEDLALAAGLVEDDQDQWWGSSRWLLGRPPDLLAELAEAAASAAAAGEGMPLADLELGPPVPDPDKIICVGLNYGLHAQELELEAPASPTLFAKFRTALVGPGAPILIPPITEQVDWEGELAVVIGRRCKDVSEEHALDCVAGCMAFNDVTARDLQMASSQWTAGKALDTFAPCGPVLVSLSELGDIQDLSIQTRVNGVTVQDGRTDAMIFSVAELVSYISRLTTLVPGDIIATGTPEGVGFRREPPMFLGPGDTVEVEVGGIGTIENPVATDGGAEKVEPVVSSTNV